MLVKSLLQQSGFFFFHVEFDRYAGSNVSLSPPPPLSPFSPPSLSGGTDAGPNRGDSIALKKKDYNTAQAAKLHLENVQRQERKLR
jgi:hypothetical protein